MSDMIDKAMKAAETPTEERMSVPVTISSTGRIVVIDCPNDMTDHELIEIAGWISVNLAGHMWATREKPSPIQIVRGRIS